LVIADFIRESQPRLNKKRKKKIDQTSVRESRNVNQSERKSSVTINAIQVEQIRYETPFPSAL